MIRALHSSPFGPLTIVSDGSAIAALTFENHAKSIAALALAQEGADDLTRAAGAQLDAYFSGTLRNFDLPLAPRGAAFPQRIWRALLELPVGGRTSYGALAARIGSPKAARAVGASVGANPISIIIPCHRVVGADGALTGFAGGIERKRYLLALEASLSAA